MGTTSFMQGGVEDLARDGGCQARRKAARAQEPNELLIVVPPGETTSGSERERALALFVCIEELLGPPGDLGDVYSATRELALDPEPPPARILERANAAP